MRSLSLSLSLLFYSFVLGHNLALADPRKETSTSSSSVLPKDLSPFKHTVLETHSPREIYDKYEPFIKILVEPGVFQEYHRLYQTSGRKNIVLTEPLTQQEEERAKDYATFMKALEEDLKDFLKVWREGYYIEKAIKGLKKKADLDWRLLYIVQVLQLKDYHSVVADKEISWADWTASVTVQAYMQRYSPRAEYARWDPRDQDSAERAKIERRWITAHISFTALFVESYSVWVDRWLGIASETEAWERHWAAEGGEDIFMEKPWTHYMVVTQPWH